MSMRRIFGLDRRELVGLDIGVSTIRMIQLHGEDGGYCLLGAGVSEIAPWGEDPQRHRRHTVAAIRECLARDGIDSRLAACGLRGPEVVVRGFEFPALPLEEIEGAVGLEASQICPFSLHESTLDCQVTSSDDKKTRGFWVAATKGLIENTLRLVHEAGLRCVLMDIDGLALLNCLAVVQHSSRAAGLADAAPRTANDDGVAAVLDVGDSCTTIAIADRAGRPFVRDIPSGSDQILHRLALDTGATREVVKAALLDPAPGPVTPQALWVGPEPAPDAGRVMQDEVVPEDSLARAGADLLDEVATTLRYYAAQNGSARVRQVLVCGGLAGTRGFVDLLSTRLYVPVAPWNPLAQMRCASTPECEALRQEAGPALAVAAGLALRAI